MNDREQGRIDSSLCIEDVELNRRMERGLALTESLRLIQAIEDDAGSRPGARNGAAVRIASRATGSQFREQDKLPGPNEIGPVGWTPLRIVESKNLHPGPNPRVSEPSAPT